MNFLANYKYDKMHASTLNRSMTDSDKIDWTSLQITTTVAYSKQRLEVGCLKISNTKEKEIRQRKGNVDKEHEIRIRRKNPSLQPRGINRSIQNSVLFFYPKCKVQAYL